MARNKFQSWLLRTQIKCDILFDPEKLEIDPDVQESKESINARFSNLPDSQRMALRSQMATHNPLPFFPLHIYKRSNPDREEGVRKYAVHWEYDRPERRLEMKKLALAGFDLTKMGNTYFKFTQLRELRRAQEAGLDVDALLDNRYNRFQLMVLNKIMRDGNDISELANPDLPANQMANAYAELVENQKVDAILNQQFNRTMDAAGELDSSFKSRDFDLSDIEHEPISFEDRLADANDRTKFEIDRGAGKVVSFPAGTRETANDR